MAVLFCRDVETSDKLRQHTERQKSTESMTMVFTSWMVTFMGTFKEKSFNGAPCLWQRVTTLFTKLSSFLLIGSFTVHVCFFIYKHLPFNCWLTVSPVRFRDTWDRMLNYMKQPLPATGRGGAVSRWSASLGCPLQSWTGCRDPGPAAPWWEAPGRGRGREEKSFLRLAAWFSSMFAANCVFSLV